jgi:hypothetical protein
VKRSRQIAQRPTSRPISSCPMIAISLISVIPTSKNGRHHAPHSSRKWSAAPNLGSGCSIFIPVAI